MGVTPSRVACERFESAALKGNPLDDPHARTLPVYLPPGYDEGGERYPVVFILAGYTGRGANYLEEKAWDETFTQRMDRLISSGACRPMLVAFPDAFTRYGGSQYLNSPAVGRYADYILELVAHVDATFRTRAGREHRAVAGKSSGGYGALTLGMRHSDVFGLVADHSGDKGFELCYKPDFPKFARAAAKFGDIAKVLADPRSVRERDGAFFDLLNIAAMSACYGPHPGALLGFDLPVDPETCALRPEVWARWEAQDPLFMLEDTQVRQALQSLRLLYFDCGNRDEFNLHFGCRQFKRRLEEFGITHHYEEFDGTHRNTTWRYDTSLALISRAMPA
ncbi:MAG: alpha/beta hydrolase-fold protein [Planctomycetota bacterium]|nr:alpha/beta hydrolase-fold protein [Planctomycetota bacterium]